VPKSDLIRFDRSSVQCVFVVVADVLRVSERVPAGSGIQVFCNEGGSLRTLVLLKLHEQVRLERLFCSSCTNGSLRTFVLLKLHEQVRLERLFCSSCTNRFA
jgi:hypothetical protein